MFKFSIREMVLLTTIVALALGWMLDHLRSARLADADANLFQLVAELNSRGAGITRDAASGEYRLPGPPGPVRSQIDGGIPEPFGPDDPLPANLKQIKSGPFVPGTLLPPKVKASATR